MLATIIAYCACCGKEIEILAHKTKNNKLYIKVGNIWVKINPFSTYILCENCSPISEE